MERGARRPKQVSRWPAEIGLVGLESQYSREGVITLRQTAGTMLANINSTYPAGKRGESGAGPSR